MEEYIAISIALDGSTNVVGKVQLAILFVQLVKICSHLGPMKDTTIEDEIFHVL